MFVDKDIKADSLTPTYINELKILYSLNELKSPLQFILNVYTQRKLFKYYF